MRSRWPWVLGIIGVVVLVIAAVGWLWATDLADPMLETESALVSGEDVAVTSDPWLTFTPPDAADTAFIFYPGGRVPPEAYAPSARSIAEAGYLTVVPSMPFGLAVLDPNAADGIIEAYPEIERWVIGGHSLGGAMAATYVDGNDDVDGLVLWGAYPAGDTDLSDRALPAGSVFASEDGLSTVEEIEETADQLPPATTFTEIEGGNHAGFGWYGPQDGDGQAAITRPQQQAQTVAATLDVLDAVEAS